MKKQLYLVIPLILVLSILTGCSKVTAKLPSEPQGNINAHFIDVGQADSILIKTDSGAMLIDGGNNEDAGKVVKYLKSQGIKKLDYVIGTHPHEDHIGGLDAVVDSFEIGNIMMPKAQSNTKTFESLLKAIKNKGLKVTTAKTGIVFELDNETKCEVLAPIYDSYDDKNDYSAVIRITHGNTSFLFEGDASTTVEKEMILNGANLKADVLKVGHHGSKSSTSKSFLKAVSPKYAVITVGKDNDYKHPHQEVLERLNNINVLRTDEDGTIIISSDGNEISVKKEK